MGHSICGLSNPNFYYIVYQSLIRAMHGKAIVYEDFVFN